MPIHIETPTDPYKIQRSLYLNLVNSATLLEMKYDAALVPPAPGLYRIGDIEPIFRSGTTYYTVRREKNSGMVSYSEIHDMSQVDSAVYDYDGRMLVSAEFMKQKLYMLSPAPTIPARSLRLLKSLFEYETYNLLSWTQRNRSPQCVLEHFKPEYRHLIDIQELLLDVRHQWAQIHDFIGDDVWCYYTFVLKDTSLYVNKCQDYRIIEWENGFFTKHTYE